MSTEPRHPIRVAAQRTGLTPATLRAWERRYGVVEPDRSDGGQRLYSDDDVERLARLRALTEAGRPIRMVADLSDEEAEALLAEDRAAQARPPLAAASSASTEGLVAEAMKLIRAMDGEELEAHLRRAAVSAGAGAFLEGVVSGMLRQVGQEWREGTLGPGHEHLATRVVERVLSWLTEPARRAGGGGRLVLATLPGERHALGARLAGAAAGLEGWQITDLGVDLPPDDIAGAAEAVGAQAVAVSMVARDGLGEARKALVRLREALPGRVALLVGGSATQALDTDGLPGGIKVLDGLADLRSALAEALPG